MPQPYSGGFFKLFMFKKAITGAVAFFLLANCLQVRPVIPEAGRQIIAGIMLTQSPVLQFFSFSSLPLGIVNALLAGEKLPAQDNTEDNRRSGDRETASCPLYFSVSQNLKTHLNRYAGLHPVFAPDNDGQPAGVFRDSLCFREVRAPSGPPVFILFIVGLFCCLLPRGSLDAIILFARQMILLRPTHAHELGFFSGSNHGERII